MRTLLLCLFLTGAAAVNDAAIADEPKKADEKKSPSKKEGYTEVVTVRKWAGGAGGKLLDPVADVPALWGEIKGKTVVYTIPKAGNSESPPKSEITDKGGVVWVVTDSKPGGGGFTNHLNYVTKKEPEKKP